MRLGSAVPVVLCLSVFSALAVSGGEGGDVKAGPAGGGGEGETVAVMMAVEGEVLVGTGADANAAKAAAKPTVLGATLREKDWVITGKNGKCQINFAEDASALKVDSDSAVQIVRRTPKDASGVNHTRLYLAHGHVRAKVARLRVKSTFEVSTPVAVCGVRGTEEDIVHIPKLKATGEDEGESEMVVFEGLVVAKHKKFPDRAFTMDPGKKIKFSALDAPAGPVEIELGDLRLMRIAFAPSNFSVSQVAQAMSTGVVPPPARDPNAGFNQSFMTAASHSIGSTFFGSSPLSTGAGGSKDMAGGSNSTVRTILVSPALAVLNPEDGDFLPGTKPPPIPPELIPSVGENSGVGF
ncbi:MAG: FecR domain-containing protein [Planctomycetota bacterium]|nr:FecR domain-containing protein [Planctomycetota bacterium]